MRQATRLSYLSGMLAACILLTHQPARAEPTADNWASRLAGELAASDQQILWSNQLAELFKSSFRMTTEKDASCSSNLTIDELSPVPVRASLLGFLGMSKCASPAILMLMRVSIQIQNGAESVALQNNMQIMLGNPCFDGPLLRSTIARLTAWKRKYTILTIASDRVEPDAITVLIFYTALHPKFDETTPYEDARTSFFKALPPNCQ